MELGLAGEHIQIRKGSGVVELRPAPTPPATGVENLSPAEALRQLLGDAWLTPRQAQAYLSELRGERLAVEHWHPA